MCNQGNQAASFAAGLALTLVLADAPARAATTLVGVDAGTSFAAVGGTNIDPSQRNADGTASGSGNGSVDSVWSGFQTNRSVTVTQRNDLGAEWAASSVNVSVAGGGVIDPLQVHTLQLHAESTRGFSIVGLSRSVATADLVFRFAASGASAPHDICFAYDWNMTSSRPMGFPAAATKVSVAGAENPAAGASWAWAAPRIPGVDPVPIIYGQAEGGGWGSFQTVTGGDYRFRVPIELVAHDLGWETQTVDVNFRLAFSDSPLTGIPAPIPEPGEWAMLLAGLGVIGRMSNRRRRVP